MSYSRTSTSKIIQIFQAITILGVIHRYNSDAAEHQNFVNVLDKTQNKLLSIFRISWIDLLIL